LKVVEIYESLDSVGKYRNLEFQRFCGNIENKNMKNKILKMFKSCRNLRILGLFWKI